MYIRDDKADEVVAGDETLQRAIHGALILLRPPGLWAFVAVQMLLTLGWGGLAGGLSDLLRGLPFFDDEHAGSIVGLLSMWSILAVSCVPVHYVVTGHRAGRARMYRFCTWSAWLGTVVGGVMAFRGGTVGIAFGGVGVAALFLARWIVSRPSYALLAAFFRGKRAHGDRVREEIRKAQRATQSRRR